jgi:glycosyltransferase involved in cell wall biosynthesis
MTDSVDGTGSRHCGDGSEQSDRLAVAVIIVTKDRPALLEEAIGSALEQSHHPFEIVVVDDGSKSPVDCDCLRRLFGSAVRVLRNDESYGLAYSRNRGVEETAAEYVIHLDDDDLLAPDAIEQCSAALCDFPGVPLAFFEPKGFGRNAKDFNRVQLKGVSRVIELGGGKEVRPDIILFDGGLFPALLRTVPVAFQRVMVARAAWMTISELRRRVYSLDPSVPSDDAAKLKLGGFLRDSEWACYAAAVSNKIILIRRSLGLVRCEGQGYSSRPTNRHVHMLQGLEIMRHLAKGASIFPELARWRLQIRDALSDATFDIAYHYCVSGNRAAAWRHLREAVLIRAKLKHLRLAARILLVPS